MNAHSASPAEKELPIIRSKPAIKGIYAILRDEPRYQELPRKLTLPTGDKKLRGAS